MYSSCEYHLVVNFSLPVSYSSKCVWTGILAIFGNRYSIVSWGAVVYSGIQGGYCWCALGSKLVKNPVFLVFASY